MEVNTEALITSVQRIPAIYDRTDKLHSNRQFMNKTWKHIGQQLNVDGNLARKKWTSIRDYFQRQHRITATVKPGSLNSFTSRKRKWCLYDAMSFLIPYVSDRPTTSAAGEASDDDVTLGDTGSEDGGQGSTQMISLHPVSVSESIMDNCHGSHMPVTSASASTSRDIVGVDPDEYATTTTLTPTQKYSYNRNNGSVFSQDNNLDHQILETLKSIQTVPVHKENDDEDLLFFRSLVPKIKCLNDIQKLELQGEVSSVVLKHIKRARGLEPPPPTHQYPEPAHCDLASSSDSEPVIKFETIKD